MGNQCGPRALTTYADKVYWVNENKLTVCGPSGGGVWSAGLDGSAGAPLYQNEASPVAIAANALSLFWLNEGDKTVKAGLHGGGTSMVIATLTGPPLAIAADLAAVHFSEVGKVSKWDITKSMASVDTSSVGEATAIVLDGFTNPYWTDTPGGVVTYFNGTSAKPFASGMNPEGLVLDGVSGVIWADKGAGKIYTTPFSGGGVSTPLAENQSAPLAVAIDATSVFWLNSSNGKGTRIMRVAR